MIHRWELAYLGRSRIPRGLSTFEIEYFFTLTKPELEAVQTRRGTLNRLGIALQLGFIKMTGRVLNSVHVLPPAILAHIGAVGYDDCRHLQDRVRQSIRHAEQALLANIDRDVDADNRRRWMKALRSSHAHIV